MNIPYITSYIDSHRYEYTIYYQSHRQPQLWIYHILPVTSIATDIYHILPVHRQPHEYTIYYQLHRQPQIWIYHILPVTSTATDIYHILPVTSAATDMNIPYITSYIDSHIYEYTIYYQLHRHPQIWIYHILPVHRLLQIWLYHILPVTSAATDIYHIIHVTWVLK